MPDTSPEAADCAAFWGFANARWESPHARDTLLRWQDRHAVDVILALFALWYPRALRRHQWQTLQTAARHWQQTRTGRIRTLRRRLHSPPRHALYRALLELELRAERGAAWTLCTQARNLAPANAPPDPAARLKLLFPDLPDDEIRDALPNLGPGRHA
ncbi:MAG: DUF2390 domain-containing protein [Pseudomonadota bacterium]